MLDENLLKQYPIGSIYITTNEQNPSEYIGGQWESYGEGRTIVGAGTGADENNVQKVFEINQTGGEYQHTLTVNEMPKHNHPAWAKNVRINTASDWNTGVSCHFTNADAFSHSYMNGYTGGDQPHNNIQPYVVTYIWKRIS